MHTDFETMARATASVLLALWCSVCIAGEHRVHLQHVPDNGIQPVLSSDSEGNVHLIYYLAKPGDRVGDLYYRRLEGNGSWTGAVRISRTAYRHPDAIGKAAFAIGADGRVHVTWFTADPAQYLYTRTDPGGTSFEPPRSVVSDHIDGVEAGAAIAVDNDRVTIAWHAGDMTHEESRRVYAISSADGGKFFGKELAISDPALGACACCSLATGFSPEGTLVLAYRSAIDGNGRHMQVMRNGDTETISEWQLDTCPVSSNAITGGWLAFETRGRILEWPMSAGAAARVVKDAAGAIRQKHPAIAVNLSGERLIVWGNAPGYIKGGRLDMTLVDNSGNPLPFSLDSPGPAEIPDYSVAAAAALPDGDFLVLY